MFHYISRKADGIAMSPECFEEQLLAMSRGGWRGVGLDQALDFLVRGKALPRKSCLLSFDDGFLDNWVHAWPLLQRHDHQGVVFATAGKFSPASTVRPTLTEVWSGAIRPEDLPPVDAPDAPDELGHPRRRDLFLNWEEARRMEASGVMRLAAHSLHHRRVFTGPEYDGFVQPGPRRHTFDRVEGPVPWGLPRFASAAGLSRPAFRPSQELLELVQRSVPQDEPGAQAFFQDAAAVAELSRAVAALSVERLGRVESEKEFRERVKVELTACKALLEDELNRPEHTLAWPWGDYAPQALEVARELGFTCFFATTMGANPAGSPLHVHRFKAKPKGGFWVRSRLFFYSTTWRAKLYVATRL